MVRDMRYSWHSLFMQITARCSKTIYHSVTLLLGLWKEPSWHPLNLDTFWRGDFRLIIVNIPEMGLIILRVVFAFVGSWFSTMGSSLNSIHLRSCWKRKASLWKWQKLQIWHESYVMESLLKKKKTYRTRAKKLESCPGFGCGSQQNVSHYTDLLLNPHRKWSLGRIPRLRGP